MSGPGGRIVGRVWAERGIRHGTIVLCAPFGRTMRHMFTPTYLLNENGFRVVTFDPTNHTGRSEGSVERYTVSGHADDIACVLDAFHAEAPVVVAVSIAARAAMRALSRRPAAGAVLLVPVVDVCRTLAAITGMDLKGMHDHDPDSVPQFIRVLGHDVSRGLLEDNLADGLAELEDCIADAREIACPVYCVASDEDEWVAFADLQRVVRAGRRFHLAVVSEACHDFHRSPIIAWKYFTAVLQALFRMTDTGGTPHLPSLHEVIQARGAGVAA